MNKNELLYYLILIAGPALFFLAILLFTKSEPKKKENP